MDVIYYVFAAATAVAALLSSIAIWAPRDTRIRVLALAVMALFMPVVYFQLTGLLSKPKPAAFAWLERNVDRAEVLSISFDEGKAKKGYVLHDKFCEKCHEDGGRSAEDDAGILAGQWTPYLQFTLNDILSGERQMPKKMAKRVEALQERVGDEGFDFLVNYWASQVER